MFQLTETLQAGQDEFFSTEYYKKKTQIMKLEERSDICVVTLIAKLYLKDILHVLAPPPPIMKQTIKHLSTILTAFKHMHILDERILF